MKINGKTHSEFDPTFDLTDLDDLTEGEIRLAVKAGKIAVTLDNWRDIASRCGIEIESGYGMHAARLGRHYLVGKDPLQLFAQMLEQV